MQTYKLFLKKDGEIHFKTDDDELYKDTLEYFKESGFDIIKDITDLANTEEENIITEHEQMFMDEGIKIKKIIARFK